MSKLARFTAVLIALATVSLTMSTVRADPTTVTIAAAANLERVLTDRLIPDFESKNSGIVVAPNYGATGLLAKQMEQGAPFELFVSADTSTVDKLVAEKTLDAASEHAYAVGQLVMWSPSAASFHPGAITDLTGAAVSHIAVANPRTAPYGAATIESLTAANILTAVEPKIVYAENIQQALQFAKTGNVDVAFTALSLVVGDKTGAYVIIPAKLHAPIVQSVAARPGASNSAKRFESYLLSKDAAKIMSTYGYLTPSAGK